MSADQVHEEALIESAPQLQNYCIAIQPICDGELGHVADELLYRDNAAATFACIPQGQAMLATARVCHIAFHEIGIERLVGKRRVYLNVPRDMLLKPALLPPYPQKLVVEVLENVRAEPAVLDALRAIRAMGFEIALDDFVLTRDTQPLLDFASIVKVDMMQPVDEQAIVHYKQKGLRLLAERVEDMPTFKRLRTEGFELFQGYFYARPETQHALAVVRSNNRAALFRLVSALCKTNADFKEIQEIIVQDSQLTFLLLRYANSAFFHYRGKIETIFQVLQVLGLAQVRNVAITLLIAKNGPASKLLLSQALTRADMCERLAGGMLKQGAESAFLAGLLSMMGPLLGKAPQAFIQELSLTQELMDAVLAHQGPLGLLLKDIEAFEQAQTTLWSARRIESFNRTWMASQVWATETLAMIDGVDV